MLTLPLGPHLIVSNFSPIKSTLSFFNSSFYFYQLRPQVSCPPSHSNSCPLSSCSESEGVSNSSTSRSELPSGEEGTEFVGEVPVPPVPLVRFSCNSGAERRFRMGRGPHRAKVLGVPGVGIEKKRTEKSALEGEFGIPAYDSDIWGEF